VAEDLSGKVLQALASGGSASTAGVYARVFPPPVYSTFQRETQRLAEVHRTLMTLKSQHRVWSDDGRQWRITERGRRV
jgi:uncharacterized protein YjhX (UPF0386 family)